MDTKDFTRSLSALSNPAFAPESVPQLRLMGGPTYLSLAPGLVTLANGSSAGADYSLLAGPYDPTPAAHTTFRVRIRSLRERDPRFWITIALATAALSVSSIFLTYLLHHVWTVSYGSWLAKGANSFVIGSIYLITVQWLVNTLSFDVASLAASDPVPVRPTGNERVAFVTTIVPSSEPFDIVASTLKAATDIRHPGLKDVWLLDEGNAPDIKAACSVIGVKHFSRNFSATMGTVAQDEVKHFKYNSDGGTFGRRRKHGNLNAFIDSHGDEYEFLAGVDPDHVPEPNYLERMLGYFRDPDVAFVVGPQDYANGDGSPIARWAESQAYPFHSVIQRSLGRWGVPMLVGTNYVIRMSALKQAGLFQDSVTEDMLTGLAIYAQRNPNTGKRWRGVYTPDVLAIGEGPSTVIDMANQQYRWSVGTIYALLGEGWGFFRKLSLAGKINYALILNFYPSMALAWIVGAINAWLYLTLGAVGIQVHASMWLMLYGWSAFLQCWLYSHNRKHNVSPFEAKGSYGVPGMLMTVFCGPVYATALIRGVFNKLTGRHDDFSVTKKGSRALESSGLLAFRYHIIWGSVTLVALVIGLLRRESSAMVYLWPASIEVVCWLPVLMWRRGWLSVATVKPRQTETDLQPVVPLLLNDTTLLPTPNLDSKA